MFSVRILRIFLVFFPFFQQVISDHKQEYRIVGGEDASISQVPWQGIFLANGSLCGCSLLSNSWAVTAAHCTDNALASEMTVGFGITSLLSVTLETIFKVIYFVNHPEYNKLTRTRNDISLLRIDGFVNYTSNIQPIALPTAGVDVADGLNCIISGWGTTRANGSISFHLQRAFVPIVNNVQCREWYSAVTHISFIHICAGYESGGIDSCQGDSGGPLACRTNTGTFVLEGITSFGVGCALPQFPGVYVRVSEYVTWIENMTLISFAKPVTPYYSTFPASTLSTPESSTPVSSAPTSPASTSSAPESSTPTTSAPTFPASTSSAPESSTPVSSAPPSPVSTSSAPESSTPVSSAPPSSAPTSPASTSSAPESSTPTTSAPTSSAPEFSTPASSAPTSPASTSSAPESSTPVSSAPTSPASTSSAPESSTPVSSAPTTSASISSAATSSTTSPFTSFKPTSFNSSTSTVQPTIFTSNISSTSGPSLLTTIKQLNDTSSLLTSSTPSNLLSTNTSESLSNQFTTKSTAVSHFVASQLYCILVSVVTISVAKMNFH